MVRMCYCLVTALTAHILCLVSSCGLGLRVLCVCVSQGIPEDEKLQCEPQKDNFIPTTAYTLLSNSVQDIVTQ